MTEWQQVDEALGRLAEEPSRGLKRSCQSACGRGARRSGS